MIVGPPFLLREAFPPPAADDPPGRPVRVGPWVAAMIVLPALTAAAAVVVALPGR